MTKMVRAVTDIIDDSGYLFFCKSSRVGSPNNYILCKSLRQLLFGIHTVAIPSSSSARCRNPLRCATAAAAIVFLHIIILCSNIVDCYYNCTIVVSSNIVVSQSSIRLWVTRYCRLAVAKSHI